MQQTQLLKGVLEGCVLLIISRKETYGYELVGSLKVAGFVDIVGGTVYPLLQKLEKNGMLESRMKASPEGPDRKYYSVTEAGKVYYQQFIHQWSVFSENVDKIIDNYEKFS